MRKEQFTRRSRQGEASTSAPPSNRESIPMEGLEDDNNQREIDYHSIWDFVYKE